VEPFSPEVLDGAGAVIDAIFGAGLSRPVEGEAAQMIEALKERKIATYAVDIPSGVDGATGAVRGIAAPAEVTVTFFRKKPGHLLLPGRFLCGTVELADIGIPAMVLEAIAPKTYENGPGLWLDRYPWPSIDGYKYTRGHALVLGGEEITGASRLAARGAMHAGAGLVTLAAPAPVWMIYAASLTGVMVRRFQGVEEFSALLADKRENAIAIGPGAGVGSETRQYVLAALATKRAVVLDADALTSFAGTSELLFRAVAGPCVLTPHEGEFARLFEFKGDKLERARRRLRRATPSCCLKAPIRSSPLRTGVRSSIRTPRRSSRRAGAVTFSPALSRGFSLRASMPSMRLLPRHGCMVRLPPK